MRHIAADKIEWPGLDLTAHPELQTALPPGVQAHLDQAIGEAIEEELLRAGPPTPSGTSGSTMPTPPTPNNSWTSRTSSLPRSASIG